MKSVLDRENELIVLKRDIEIIFRKLYCGCFKGFECPKCSILRRLKELQEYKEDKDDLRAETFLKSLGHGKGK